MDLIELRQALRRWWIHGVITFLVVAIGATIALGPAETRYGASSTLVVAPRAERFESVSTGVLRIVLPNVIAVARSHEVHDAVAARLGPLGDEAVSIDGTFVHDSGVLTLTARSPSGAAALAWSVAAAEEIAQWYEDDDYLVVDVLDRARTANALGPVDRAIDLTGVAILSVFAGILAIFALQRLRETGDIAARVRSDGLRVLAELVVPGRDRRPSFKQDAQAGRLALSLVAADGTDDDVRFVIASNETRQSLAVVDAARAGLHQAGLHRRHKVVLGPDLKDLPRLRQATHGDGRCVAVLDSTEGIDSFARDVNALLDAGIPVIGVVIVHRRLLRRPQRAISVQAESQGQRRRRARTRSGAR